MLTLFHDYTSPASAVAVLRMGALAEEGLPIAFESFEALAVDLPLPPDLDCLAQLQRLAPQAEALGLAWRRPPRLPPTGLAHVLTAHAAAAGAGRAVREALYRALWVDGADIADRQVLARIARAHGVAGHDEVLADRVALAACRRRMAAHRRAGVGGVPVILASRTLVPGLLSEQQVRALAASA